MKTILFLAARTSENPVWVDIIQIILPLLLILPLVWLLRRMASRQLRVLDRSMENMAAMEKKADRIIELFEEANKKK
jgi:flagellar biogenesis protein FliO